MSNTELGIERLLRNMALAAPSDRPPVHVVEMNCWTLLVPKIPAMQLATSHRPPVSWLWRRPHNSFRTEGTHTTVATAALRDCR